MACGGTMGGWCWCRATGMCGGSELGMMFWCWHPRACYHTLQALWTFFSNTETATRWCAYGGTIDHPRWLGRRTASLCPPKRSLHPTTPMRTRFTRDATCCPINSICQREGKFFGMSSSVSKPSHPQQSNLRMRRNISPPATGSQPWMSFTSVEATCLIRSQRLAQHISAPCPCSRLGDGMRPLQRGGRTSCFFRPRERSVPKRDHPRLPRRFSRSGRDWSRRAWESTGKRL
mmetsp:Transcript_18780/g.43340  ORF Transcript_18780/g.43340 Transcript_18780/m.43340 type:complete len:232 (-) Transcript_18780:2296-2991(-)